MGKMIREIDSLKIRDKKVVNKLEKNNIVFNKSCFNYYTPLFDTNILDCLTN